MYTGPYYFHQPGHNQHKRAYTMLTKGIGDGVVFAASTTTENRLSNLIQECCALNKPVLLDPEQYNPTELNIDNPENNFGTEILLDPMIRATYVENALTKQHDLGCTGYIIPNVETHSISDSWIQTTRNLCETAREWIAKHGNEKKDVYLTIALPSSDIANAERRQDLINHLSRLRTYINGFYLNVIGIPPFVSDENLIKSMLHTVFKLKWQDFNIILSKTGAWVPLMFPIGLDTFGNDGFQTQQQVRPSRDKPTGGGGGYHPHYPVWSVAAMSYIRFPDDALPLHQRYGKQGIDQLYGAATGFAPPSDRSPDEVFASSDYEQENRLNHFSTHMARMANQYKDQSLNSRIESVQRQVNDAYQSDQNIGQILGNPKRGLEKLVWLNSLNRFIEETRDDLEELYG